MAIDLKQRDLNEWQKRNFGEPDVAKYAGLTPEMPAEEKVNRLLGSCYKLLEENHRMRLALGMSEEVGELCHWLLKGMQGIRGVDKENCVPEVGDAFADTIIYGIQEMTALGIDAEQMLRATITKVLQRDWVNNPKGEGISQHKQAEP